MNKKGKEKRVHFRIEEEVAKDMEELREDGLNWSALLRKYIKDVIKAHHNKPEFELNEMLQK